MNKSEFLELLRSRLDFMTEAEAKKTLQFYSEMIDDRVEDGITEQEAVENLGDIDGIIEEIKNSLPKEAVPSAAEPKKESSKTLWIVLAVCGFPVWVPLALAAFVIILAAYICIIAVVISIGVIIPSLALAALAGVFSGAVSFILGLSVSGVAQIGLGISCAGLAIMLAKPLWWVCREAVLLIPKSVKLMIRPFTRKGRCS